MAWMVESLGGILMNMIQWREMSVVFDDFRLVHSFQVLDEITSVQNELILAKCSTNFCEVGAAPLLHSVEWTKF